LEAKSACCVCVIRGRRPDRLISLSNSTIAFFKHVGVCDWVKLAFDLQR